MMNNIEISLDEVNNLIKNSDKKIEFIDIRGEIAFNHGHIEGAALIDMEKILKNESVEEELSKLNLSKDKIYVLYCKIGVNSVECVKRLRNMGYTAFSIKGGFSEWIKNNVTTFSENEKARYDRQMLMPEIGLSGQEKLKRSKVLIVGAGGLGSPVALYLAAAGVGTLGIIDADRVNLSNLHRQIIHNTKSVNINKAASAKNIVYELNENVNVITYEEFLTPDNVEEIFLEYDFIVDAVDNFETKFLINDACVLHNKPFCHAGVLRFQGQVMTYVPGKGPCYRCIFQEIPEKGSVPNCSEVGVMGAMVGIIGSIQALEVIKYLTDAGELLTGKMLVFDGLSMKSRIVKFPNKSDSCGVCGENKRINSIIENKAEYLIKGCGL